MKVGYPGRPMLDMFVIHALLLHLHLIIYNAVNSPFECFEQNDHSECVQFPLAIIED